MKLKFMFLASLLLLSVIAMSTGTVKALPFDNEYTDNSLTSGDYDSYYISLTTGDVLSGYYETDDPTMGLDFFIADDTNYNLWVASSGGSGYEVATNMHTNYFSLTIPSTDTWWIVFINNDDVTVWFDAAVDVNGENYPVYSDTTYDFTAYGEVLEVDEWYYVWDDFDAGTVISGHFSTYFTSDGVDFFICDESNYNTWDSGSIPTTRYGLKTNYHQANIDSFTIPTSGTWYLVFSNVDKVDTVTLSVGVLVDTSGATTGTTPTTGTGTTGAGEPMDITTIIIALAAIIGLVVCLVVCTKMRKPSPGPTPGYIPTGPPPSSSTMDIVEGALKSYPRISMTELSGIVGLPVDEVRRATLKLIATDEIHGTFDKDTDEFTSVQASQVGRELRETADGRTLARCPNCGAPLKGSFVIGDKVKCDSCGIEYTV